MSKLRCHITMSLDGFVAGPNQSQQNPLGGGAEGLHQWLFSLAPWRESHDHEGGEINDSARIVAESRDNVGAGVMGRNMFGPAGGGSWDERWADPKPLQAGIKRLSYGKLAHGPSAGPDSRPPDQPRASTKRRALSQSDVFCPTNTQLSSTRRSRRVA